MTSVARFELLLALIAVTISLELLALRLRLPPAAMLILGGIALTLLPGAPDLELDPNLALVLFLPPLLMAGAFFTFWRDFRANLRIILQLAVGAVVFTTLVVGVVAHWVDPGLPWAACFALGAIVSPPDAVAAKAVLQRLSLPPRLVLLLEGESLVNDATGLVLYRFAVAAALTGSFDAGRAVLSFVELAVGGVVAGAAFGVVALFVLSRLAEPTLAVIGSLLIAWGTYIGGEALQVSGVLSTVAAGLVIGWRQHAIFGAEFRAQARGVWLAVVLVLESLVFILIGLSLRSHLVRLGGTWSAIEVYIPTAVATVGAVVGSRFLWIFPLTYLPRALSPKLRRRDPYPSPSVPLVMSWAGMRGVVSLAAALALPDGFPGRDLILLTTFLVILVTVLIQGSTLAPLVRALEFGNFELEHAETLSEAAARAQVLAAQLAAVRARAIDADGTNRHPRLVEQYTYRAEAASRFSAAEAALVPDRNAHFGVVLAANAAGREELLRLHRAGRIHDSVLRTLEQELDLEELSARRHEGALPAERRPFRADLPAADQRRVKIGGTP